MSKTKHVHHLAMRVKPRPPLIEVWCPGGGEVMYTVEPGEETSVALLAGHLVVEPKKRRKKSKEA